MKLTIKLVGVYALIHKVKMAICDGWHLMMNHYHIKISGQSYSEQDVESVLEWMRANKCKYMVEKELVYHIIFSTNMTADEIREMGKELKRFDYELD